MKKINVQLKSSELVSILSEQFKGNFNLSRIKFISLFICALCKVQNVGFEKLSNAFDCNAKSESSMRRIQRFIANFTFCGDMVARLIFSMLPDKENLKLSVDRTNWKYGQTDINIFMLGIVYKGVAFPLLFTMLEKRGNSNIQERIDLVERFIRLFGKDCIDCLLADREFVGDDWVSYLNANFIRYYIRIRKNFKVFLPRKNKEVKAFWLFNQYQFDQFTNYKRIVRIGTQLCYISGCPIRGKKGKRDFLIIISFNKSEQSQLNYACRWQIETCFKAMKSSGFNIKKTHLVDIKRIEKLLLLVMIAFVWCYKVGIYLHKNVKKIKIKKHGRKAKSIFKYGLNHVSSIMLNACSLDSYNITSFLSCT
jgi:hypothetical protein